MKNTKIPLIHMHLFFDGNEKIINTEKKNIRVATMNLQYLLAYLLFQAFRLFKVTILVERERMI
jgi:hypothetical protein